MNTQTLKHDRRKRHERKAAKERAIQAKERAELLTAVKADAIKLAAGNSAFKSKWRIEKVTGMRYEEMTIKQKIEVLENVIKVYRELGSRLMKEYDVKKLGDLEERIGLATGEIIRLSISEVDQAFEAADPDKVEDQPASRNPGTNIKSSLQTGAMKTNALKTINRTDDELRVGNYMALFGGRDIEGEHFTSKTDFESAYTRSGMLDVDWEHGLGQMLDGAYAPGKNEILGYVDWKTAKIDKMGLWVERVLDRRNWYMKYVEVLIDAGVIANSSEAYLPDVVTTKSGEIKKWPLMRDTLTVMPMEPRMMTSNVLGAVKGLAKATRE